MKFYEALITTIFHRMKRSRLNRRRRKTQENPWVRWTVGGVLVVALVSMFPSGRSVQFADMKEGSISTRRIVAPFNFEILKTQEELQRDREAAVQKVVPIFVKDSVAIVEAQAGVNAFFAEAVEMRSNLAERPDLRKVLIDSLFRKYPVGILDTLIRARVIDPRFNISRRKMNEFQGVVHTQIRDILSVGLFNTEKAVHHTPERRVIVLAGSEEVLSGMDAYYDPPEAKAKIVERMNGLYPNDPTFAQLGYGIVNFFLRPNLIYDEVLHSSRISEARARVPLSSGFVYENEKVVDRNERITPEIRKKLSSLAAKMAEKGMGEGGLRILIPLAGKVTFVLALIFIFIIFIQYEFSEILRRNKDVLLISLVVFLVALFSFVMHRLDMSEYLSPTPIGAMVLATVFGTHLGLAGAAVMSVLIGALWGNEYNLMVFSFFVSTVSVLIIKRMRDRRHLVYSVFSLVGVCLATITFMGFLRFMPMNEIIGQWPWGAVAGLLTPVVTAGLLPLVESLFDITTDFSLLELSNLNHPLLKRLSVQAPGTYHHSIIVGNLSEAAAQAVGANSLLARVGSYYHDAGKIDKAEYFSENQMHMENPHKKLTPRMSALILMNHVKKGVELSENYRLPQSIKDIVLQHQGTTVMSFFYRKALEKSDSADVREEDYRYPGPRPQTKEAAIVMLADVVEAATRSLKAPTHSRLKGIVEELVDARFKEGQLDESPLTLRDLERIKESFLTILAGTFHTRVEYPEKGKTETNEGNKNGHEDPGAESGPVQGKRETADSQAGKGRLERRGQTDRTAVDRPDRG